MRVRTWFRRIKRLTYLGGLAGTAFALRQAKARRDAHIDLGPPATWPPLEVGEPPVAAVGDLVTAASPPANDEIPGSLVADEPVVSDEPVAAVGDVAAEDPTEAAWVRPDDDGSCPLTHPIKANTRSGIFHRPGSQVYVRTRAERCYRDAAAAEADGYRAAKSS